MARPAPVPRPSPPAPPEKPSVASPPAPVTERPTATPPVAAPDTGPAGDAPPKPIPPPEARPSISAEHTHQDRAAEPPKQEPRHYLIERKRPEPQDPPGGDGP
jgi:hypothetical protein